MESAKEMRDRWTSEGVEHVVRQGLEIGGRCRVMAHEGNLSSPARGAEVLILELAPGNPFRYREAIVETDRGIVCGLPIEDLYSL